MAGLASWLPAAHRCFHRALRFVVGRATLRARATLMTHDGTLDHRWPSFVREAGQSAVRDSPHAAAMDAMRQLSPQSAVMSAETTGSLRPRESCEWLNCAVAPGCDCAVLQDTLEGSAAFKHAGAERTTRSPSITH